MNDRAPTPTTAPKGCARWWWSAPQGTACASSSTTAAETTTALRWTMANCLR